MKASNSLLQDIKPLQQIGELPQETAGICFDSRQAAPGCLFVATRGNTTDGHQYIDQAVSQGAGIILCEELPKNPKDEVCYLRVADSAEALGQLACAWHGHPSKKLKLLGVTGTNGKTTIATLLYRLFREAGYPAGLLSTVCNYVNDRAIEATHTTPDTLTLNALLADMVESGCEYAFMEVSSHAVEQRRIAGLQFEGGIFTNLTRDHLDYHLSFENYLRAKKRFFDELPKTAFALSNADDRNGNVMLQNCSARHYNYSLRSMADFHTRMIEHSFEGMLLNLNGREMHSPFIGRFNAANLTAVYGASCLLGMEPEESLRIMSALQPVSGRFEALRAPAGYTAIVDYAHTPDALNNVIGTINEILEGSGGRLITVVGCGGNRDRGKRPLMAREAVAGSWKVIFTSDNPRFEEPQSIIEDMLAGLEAGERRNCLSIVDRREAIRTATALAQAGDVVLVAGKGHEDYQIIQGEKRHFDDREELRAAF